MPSFSLTVLLGRFVSLILSLCAASSALQAKTAELAWDPNPEQNIVSYTLRYGTTSGNYTETVTVTQTSVTLTNLSRGTYYCTVTARNSEGLESPPSDELSFDVTIDAPSLVGISDGQGLNATGSITLQISAWEAGTSRVEIYAGSTLVATADPQSSTLTWRNTQPGDYTLTVTAYDTDQNVVTSTPLSVHLVRPAVTDLKRTADSAFEMTVTGAAGRVQHVEVSEDLKVWTPFASAVNATGAMVIRDESMPQAARRFYRVLSE